MTQYFPTLTNIAEIQAQELHAVYLITICRISHFTAFGKTTFAQVRGTHLVPGRGWALQRLSPWAPGSRAKTHKTAKRSTPEQLRDWPWLWHMGGTRRALKGTVEIHLRAPWIHSQISSPCPKLILQGCGLKIKTQHGTWASVKLHGPLRTPGCPKGINSGLKEDPGLCFSYRWGMNFLIS